MHEHPAEAVAGGWIVQAPYDFRSTPIRLHDGMVALLNDYYGYDVLEWPQNPSRPGTALRA